MLWAAVGGAVVAAMIPGAVDRPRCIATAPVSPPQARRPPSACRWRNWLCCSGAQNELVQRSYAATALSYAELFAPHPAPAHLKPARHR